MPLLTEAQPLDRSSVIPADVGLPKAEVESSLRYGTKDGVFFSLMSGFGESYLGVFAIFLKATPFQIGLLASLPQLIGAFFQLFSVKVLNHLKNRKRLIVASVSLQTFSWILIFTLPFLFPVSGPWLLILSVTFFYTVGNFSTPAWNSLMGDLVDPNLRGAYFGRRNQLMSIFAFLSLCLGGVTLHLCEQKNLPWVGFMIIFSLAFISRGCSTWALSKVADPPVGHHPRDDFSVMQFLRAARQSNFGRFAIYTSLIHFSVNVAGPFFAVYMLRDLGLSYLQFMEISAVAVMVQFITLNYWGRFADRFGNKQVLTLTGIMIPILPVLWLFSSNFFYLALIQLLGGFVWAGFMLSMGNYVFDTVGPPKRARCVAIYNCGNALGIFLGASLGGLLALWLPARWNLFGQTFGFHSNLLWIFLLSGLLRFFISFGFLKGFREVRQVQPFSVQRLFFRVSQIRPIGGLRFELFTGGDSNNALSNKKPGEGKKKTSGYEGEKTCPH